jgi:hypothetical protein
MARVHVFADAARVFHLLQGGDLWAGGLRVERRAEAARLLSDYRSEGGRVASSV